jgi:O-antigen/teichoic acid export membrane protein
VAPEFVAVVLGPKWVASTIPLQFLAAVAPLRLFSPVVSSFLRAIGQLRISVRNTFLGLVLLPIAIAIGCHWGIVGASVAWLCVYPIFFGHVIVRTCRAVGIPVAHILKAIGNSGVGAALMYLVVYAGRQAISDQVPTPVVLVILIALGAVSYVGYCVAFNRASLAELLSLVRS